MRPDLQPEPADGESEDRQRARELQTLVDNTPDVLTRFDLDLRHVFVNAAIERITGRSPEDIIGRTNRELDMPEELCFLWETATRSVFATGKPEIIHFSFPALDGMRHFMSQHLPEYGPTGEITHVLAVTRDRTAEVTAQDALRLADRRKDEFLATLAHELRNPLAPIRTGLDVLRRTNDVDIARRTQEMMDRQLGHMVRLIDDLLEVSRITSGKVVLRRERMTLQSAISVAVESVRPQLERARHRFILDLPEQPIWLDADPTRIAQIVSNLIGNAVKYSPDESTISVAARLDGGDALASVQDTGVGIPAEMLGQVFDMFAQVDRTLDRAQGGLGIGLAIVKRLAEMHRGTVIAESPGLGQGSTFTLRLPAVAQRAAGEGASAPVKITPRRQLRVLVVDDNVDAAQAIEQLLRVEGHHALVAYSGQEALDVAREFRPDVAFLDLGMPGMNGFETARRFRQGEHLHSTLLVALTGWGTDEDRHKSASAGFDRHLTKPIEAAELEEVIRSAQSSKVGAQFRR